MTNKSEYIITYWGEGSRGEMAFHKHKISDFVALDMSQTRALVKRSNDMQFNKYQIPCINLYNVYQGPNKCI